MREKPRRGRTSRPGRDTRERDLGMPAQPTAQPSRPLARACACGCPRPIPGDAHARRIYFDDACRMRVRRRRLREALKAAGLPALLTIENLQGIRITGAPERHAQNGAPARESKPRTPRPGVTVYIPTIGAAEALTAALRDLDGPAAHAHADALERAIQRHRARAR